MSTQKLALLCLACLLTLRGWSEETPTKLTIGGGFGQTAFVENAEPEQFQWTNLRLIGSLDGKRIGVGFAFNFADWQEPDSNWLRQLRLKIPLTDSLELDVGRILHSVGNGKAIPGPHFWETVRFPRSLPWHQYGTGIQFLWNHGPWSGIVDLTGNSKVPFDDPKSLDDLEFSGRIKRTFHNQERELGYLAGSVQLTKEVRHYGFDGQWQPVESLTLRGGVFWSDFASEKHSNRLGGFFLAAYRPTHARWLELHTLLDITSDWSKEYEELQKQTNEQGNVTYQMVTFQTSDATEITWINGVRFFFGKDDCWAATVDYEWRFPEEQQEERGQFLFRLSRVF